MIFIFLINHCLKMLNLRWFFINLVKKDLTISFYEFYLTKDIISFLKRLPFQWFKILFFLLNVIEKEDIWVFQWFDNVQEFILWDVNIVFFIRPLILLLLPNKTEFFILFNVIILLCHKEIYFLFNLNRFFLLFRALLPELLY